MGNTTAGLTGNITNSSLPLGNDTDRLVLAGRYLALFIGKPLAHLNVSRKDLNLFVLILIAKNFMVCHGIFNLAPMRRTYQFLFALTFFVFVFRTAQCVVNFALVWAVFGAIWFLTTETLEILPPISRSICAITLLTAIPPNVNIPCTLESVLDILLLVYMGWFLIRNFLGPFESIYEVLFGELTVFTIFLAIDTACRANGNYFMLLTIIVLFFPLVVGSYRQREMFFFLPLLVLFNICLIDQVSRNLKRPAEMTMIMDQFKNPVL